MPKISCVMPTRNRGDMIGETISSIISQTEKDWELIIVNDHGDDNTKEVVESFKDKRIKYFKLDDKNGMGIACARNFCSIMANSKYLAVMDSDDLCYENRFELTLKEFEKTGADIVYGECDLWYPETGEVKKRTGEYSSREFNLEYLKNFNFIPHATVAYKKTIATDFPYNSFFEIAEDYELYLRLASQGKKFSFIDKSLIKRRVHQGSIMKQKERAFDYSKIAQEIHNTKI